MPLCIVSRTFSFQSNSSFSEIGASVFLWKKIPLSAMGLMRCMLQRETSFSTTGNGCHSIKIVLLQSFSSDYFLLWFFVPCCRPHCGFGRLFPLGFTKVGTGLHCTVEGTVVSTVTVIEKAKILLLAGNRSRREVREPTDATLSHGL